MSRVRVPPRAEPVAPLGVDESSAQVAQNVRSCAGTVSGVHDEVAARGLPGEWSGAARAGAGYAFAAFGRHSDVTLAALETAALGLDVYAEQVAELMRRRQVLAWDRVEYDADRDELRVEVHRDGPTADDAQVERWQARADRLQARLDHLTGAVARVFADLADAEDRVVAVLRSVDTDVEGRAAADDGGRPDVALLLDRLRSLASHPVAVRAWWNRLSAAQREALTIGAPDVVGNADGVPVVARDRANRTALTGDLDRLRTRPDLTDPERRELQNALATQRALDDAAGAVDPTTGRPVDVELLAYDPAAFDGDGAGALAYGDPDTADNTVVMVPGLGNDLSSLGSLGHDALHVYRAAALAAPGRHPAVVAWMGYDAPNVDPGAVGSDPGGLGDLLGEGGDEAGVTREADAEEGGRLLDRFVGGLRASDVGPRCHLVVLGHSYGSTTTAHGAAEVGLGLRSDDVVLVGSPGAGDGVDRVGGLHHAPGHVFVGAADNDPVTWLGGGGRLGLGEDPAQASFGATRFSVDPGPDFHLGQLGSVGFATHVAYYDPHSVSLANIARIADGQAPDVVPGRDEPARHHLARWLEHESAYQVLHHVPGPVRQVGHWVDEGLHRLPGL